MHVGVESILVRPYHQNYNIMKNRTTLPLMLGVLATIILIAGCRLKIGRTGGAAGSILRVPLLINSVADCDTLLSVQGAFCFSDTSAFNFIAAIPKDPSNWVFNYNTDNHAFTLFTLNPEGVPISVGDTLFSLIIQLNPEGEVGDYSRISFCNHTLLPQMSCIDSAETEVPDFGHITGRVEIQDQINFSGMARTIEDPQKGIEEVRFRFLSDYANLKDTTDSDGNYGFSDVLSGHYKVLIQKDDRSTNMYSTFGLVQMARHVSNIEYLNPYYLLAADIDCDGDLDFDDVFNYNDVLLGFTEDFGDCGGWLFVPEGHTFDDPQNPFDLPAEWPVNIFSNTENINFIGIEKGILPGSYPQPLMAPSIELDIDIQQNNHQVQVAFRTPKDLDLSGFQLALDYNADQLIFKSSAAKSLPNLNLNKNFRQDGLLLMNSFENTGESFTVPKGSILFELTFDVTNKTLNPREQIWIDHLMLSPVAYDQKGRASEIRLRQLPKLAKIELHKETSFELQNYPNPFRNQTTFQFEKQGAGKAELLIYNIQGVLVEHLKGNFDAGKQQFQYQNPGLSTGIYYYSLHQNGKVMSRSMQVLD